MLPKFTFPIVIIKVIAFSLLFVALIDDRPQSSHASPGTANPADVLAGFAFACDPFSTAQLLRSWRTRRHVDKKWLVNW
jgi:hypothetical protein